MQIVSGTTEFVLNEKYCVAVGKFDGIHRGHQYLIDCINEYKAKGYKTAIMTFDPSPAAFFGDGRFQGLTTRDEKRHIFEKLGIDVVVEYPLNKESAAVSPEDFVENILVKGMNAGCVVCGPDFTFGDKGRGNVALLEKLGAKAGFDVKVCEKVHADEKEISSSLIREQVQKGDMRKVAEYIGAPYSITGIVTRGRQIGRTIGMPTVNIVPEEDKLLPPYGVYSAIVSYKDKHYRGITNVGVKPTVTDENKPVVETFIFGFDEDIYDEYITVNLINMVRVERSFDSIDELKAQIEKDIVIVKSELQ